jgi:hypothetical protein
MLGRMAMLVRLWDRDFNCLHSQAVNDIGEWVDSLTITTDPCDEDGNASQGWRARTSYRISTLIGTSKLLHKMLSS